MKPRWKIDPLWHVRFVYDYRPLCREAEWFWVRHDRNGTRSVVGCVCHHSWTQRVKAFKEGPQCGEQWVWGAWCRRGGGTYSRHKCIHVDGSGINRDDCLCACGATNATS